MSLIWLFFALGACASAGETASEPAFEYVAPEGNLPGWYEKRNIDGSICFVEKDRLRGGIVKRVILQEVESLDRKHHAIIDLSDEDVDEAFRYAFSPSGEPLLRMDGTAVSALESSGVKIPLLDRVIKSFFSKCKDKKNQTNMYHHFYSASSRRFPKVMALVADHKNGSFTFMIKTIENQTLLVRFDLIFDHVNGAYLVTVSVEKGLAERYAHILYGISSMLFQLDKINNIHTMLVVIGLFFSGFACCGFAALCFNWFKKGFTRGDIFLLFVSLSNIFISLMVKSFLDEAKKPLFDEKYSVFIGED